MNVNSYKNPLFLYDRSIMNERFIIRGRRKLEGEIDVKGAKNSVGNLMMATLLTDEQCVLTNVPDNKETEIVAGICEHIGSAIRREGDTLRIHTPEIKNFRVTELSRKNRIPILALGPLLVRSREAEVPLVGGDRIGPRPVDFHIGALEKLGAELSVTDSAYVARAPRGLFGTKIILPYPSVGATQNIILSAVRAKGKTVIANAAVEPEIIDLIRMLQDMGGIIGLNPGRVIEIEGVQRLRGVTHRLIPDRLEAASFAMLAAATDGDICVEGAVQDHLVPFLNAFRKIGGEYDIDDSGIRFYRKFSSSGPLFPIEIETDTFPGFVTDWQQPFAVLLTQSGGRSAIHETVYEDRFNYVEDLRMMGADMAVHSRCFGVLPCRFQGKGYNHTCVISGPTPLNPARIEMRDIRSGMAHMVAAFIADGVSEITGVEHIDRGYEKIDERLRAVGADIERINQ